MPEPPGAWQDRGWLSTLLCPAAGLFAAAAAVRRIAYKRGWLRSRSAGVPVVVVGNITVGGTGKTPVTGWLAQSLLEAGRRPAIVSRGYGGRRQVVPVRVGPDSDAREVGDEPVMLARQAGCPVWVCIDRAAAARKAAAQGAGIVLSDDGLQHYRMARDVEICVIDGDHGVGNGRRLPAGPLREPAARLREVDEVLVQGLASGFPGIRFELRIDRAVRLNGRGQRPLADFAGRRVLAVAGVGVPQRFHAALAAWGIEVEPVPAPDHGRVSLKSLKERNLPIIMTAKDTVKYPDQSGSDIWWTPAEVYMPEDSREKLMGRILAILDADRPR